MAEYLHPHADEDPTEVVSILEMVAADFGYDREQLIGRCRSSSMVRARHTAALVLRRALGLSYPQIGHALGGRDHSTAHHAVHRMTELEESSFAYRLKVAKLTVCGFNIRDGGQAA